MEQNKLLECIDFFNRLDIQLLDVTNDSERQNGVKVVEALYKYQNCNYRTNRLYYKDISLLNYEKRYEYQNYFGEPIYWLDIEKHPWPQGSADSDLDEGVIHDITDNIDFRKLLYQIANNEQNGYIQLITADGRPGQYFHNLENNNHWHDIILLIKEYIRSKGNYIDLKYFKHLVFKWNGVKPNRHRTTLAYGSNDEDRKMIKDLMKNIASIQTKLEKMKYTNLLEKKHQIILQGPPGTGKTRKAKEIAKELCLPEEITEEEINIILKEGTKINSATNYTVYEVLSLNKDTISVKLENDSIYKPSITNVMKAYKNKLWLGGQVGGNHPYEAALAKYIYENYPLDTYCKLVQFHPSYTYEDFVRGISVKTVNGFPSYETENRTLMEFANAALENYLNTKKPSAELSKEKWVASELNSFAESIAETIANGQLFELTENVNIIDIQDDAFIYTGNTWQAVNGHRMKFSDIIKAFMQDANSRPEYKKVLGISGRARQHASYDFKLLVKFKAYVNNRPSFIETSVKNDLKNYVLIIDEINRANLSSVLGELIYALEYRNESVESIYEFDGDRNLVLPSNLKIIGTMNTADRSVGHIDYAIRRRFAFVDVLPEIEPVHESVIDKFRSVASLFVKNFDANPQNWVRSEHMAADFQPHEVMIGHSYFICKKDGSNDDEEDIKAKEILDLKMEFEVVPILKEYIKDGILNDTDKVKEIINGLIS